MIAGKHPIALAERAKRLAETRRYRELEEDLVTMPRARLLEDRELGYYLAVAYLHLRRSRDGISLTNGLLSGVMGHHANVLDRRIELLRAVFLGREGKLREAEQSILRCYVGTPLDVPAKLTASINNSYGVILSQRGEWEQAIPQLVRARAIYGQVGDELGVANANHNLGLANRYLGRCAEAEELFSAASTYFSREGTHEETVFTEGERSLAVLGMGDWRMALRMAEKSLEGCRKLSNEELLPEMLRILAINERESGNLNSAKNHFVEALKYSRTQHNHQLTAEILVEIGRLQRARGRRQSAARYLRRAATFFGRTGATGFERIALAEITPN